MSNHLKFKYKFTLVRDFANLITKYNLSTLCVLIFITFASCRRYIGATVPQDMFATNCSTIKLTLQMASVGKSLPMTKLEIDGALSGSDITDPYGQKYLVEYIKEDIYRIQFIGKDGIQNTNDDRLTYIRMEH